MTPKKFTVCWQAEDGYVTGSRPQKFDLTAEDIEGMTMDEAEAFVDEVLQDHFNERVSAAIQNYQRLREWLVATIAKEQK